MGIVCCPRCGSNSSVKSGHVKGRNGEKTQLYRCKKCRHHFRRREGYGYKKKNPKVVIEFAVALSKSENPAYSTRDISNAILKEFGVKISHTAVSKWIGQLQFEVKIDMPHIQKYKTQNKPKLITFASTPPPPEQPKQTVNSILSVPCFRCLVNHEVSEYYCAPSKCPKLEVWLPV